MTEINTIEQEIKERLEVVVQLIREKIKTGYVSVGITADSHEHLEGIKPTEFEINVYVAHHNLIGKLSAGDSLEEKVRNSTNHENN